LVRREADCSQIQCFDVADSSHRVEQHVSGDGLSMLKMDCRASRVVDGYVEVFLPESHRDPILLHLSLKGLRDFQVQEPQHLCPPIDQGDVDSERSQHGGVLSADDTSSDHDDAGRIHGGAEEGVRVANNQIVKRNFRGTAWSRACGQYDA
jgi:hypothetical protein